MNTDLTSAVTAALTAAAVVPGLPEHLRPEYTRLSRLVHQRVDAQASPVVVTERDLQDIIRRLHATAGKPSMREIAHAACTSAATVSRVFNGASTTWSVLQGIVGALGGTGEDLRRCHAIWEARRDARRAAKGTTQSAPTESAPMIELHSGQVYITDAASTEGKDVVVHGGDIYLSNEAANAAANIIIHGGNVYIGRADVAGAECDRCGAWVRDQAVHQQFHDHSDAAADAYRRLRPVG